ncbi:MAG: SDR family oxidoreductase [Planctomycetota bacterium]
MDERALDGQVALVTGGSRGIGRAVVRRLTAAGAAVGINYRSSRDAAEELVEEISRSGGRALALPGDTSQERDVQECFELLRDAYGAVHCVVANAGVEANASAADMSLADWQQVIDVDLTGAFLCAREGLREFHRRTDPDVPPRLRGTIIAVTSVHDRIPFGAHGNYCAAKAGVSMLMRTIALEEGARRIRANTVAPGAIGTDINRDTWEDPEERERLFDVVPHDRIGRPEEVAEAVAWLASDAAAYVTGTSLVVDGGMTCYPSFLDKG